MTLNNKNFVSASQIRAARALLDWSQEDLASASDLSIATIHKIESGQISPRNKTISSIISTMEQANIEFTSPMGVQLKSNDVRVLEGEDAYLLLLDDVYHTLKKQKGEALVWNADNSVSPESAINSVIRMRKEGIRFRYLVEEGNTFLHGPLEEYRWVPKEFFLNNVQEIYGNKVAFPMHSTMATQQAKRIVIIESAALAESMRNAFNFMWQNCRKPTLSTAPRVYG
ncbi:MAG: helix-turn-helix transcriptional regulator [Alphaproteobacteria bacterium]